MAYLFWRWLHIVAIISWMAGILYIFRLFIYHKENQHSPDVCKLFPTMERRLYKSITLPAMLIAALAATAMLALNHSLLLQTWLQIKLVCVLALMGFTFYAGHLVKIFADPSKTWPESKTLRIMNEGPTLLMLIIVLMVVFRPFS